MNDSRQLIDSLRRPGVLWGGSERAEVLETHISWVLLAGPFAWKIKKPVNLGFVDFTTLERRRRFCHEELRLNRRLAPNLYLDVVSLSGTPEAPRLGETSHVIEYAVKMRRFPQHDLLVHVVERGELQPGQIDDLARQLAEFHQGLAPGPADGPYGHPQQVVDAATTTLEHLRSTSAGQQASAILNRLSAWIHSEALARHEDFARRRDAACIRECHGDLHLGNIVLWDGTPTCFDGIEFNEELRWIDVLSEIAFIVMDLERHGRPDLAARLLNTYLEHTGDYEGLIVLPFYVVYRALVRAMVDGLRLAQQSTSREPALRVDLQSYLEVADRWTHRSRPLLTITCGVSGSGKTTGTQPLLEQLGAIRIRSDVERKRMFGMSAMQHSDSGRGGGIYTADASTRTYQRLAELAEHALRAGFPIIVDATFLRRADRRQFQQLAERASTPFQILSFTANEETLRRRIISRNHKGDASEATLEVLADQLMMREDFAADEQGYVVSAMT
jgi:aminoglycoside phosphotransferase family enzyme/predicted kinase